MRESADAWAGRGLVAGQVPGHYAQPAPAPRLGAVFQLSNQTASLVCSCGPSSVLKNVQNKTRCSKMYSQERLGRDEMFRKQAVAAGQGACAERLRMAVTLESP